MALKNNENNYLKIDNVEIEKNVVITYTIYKSENSRLNGLPEFEEKKRGIKIYDNIEFHNEKDDLKNNLLTSAYFLLKNNEFNSWVDC